MVIKEQDRNPSRTRISQRALLNCLCDCCQPPRLLHQTTKARTPITTVLAAKPFLNSIKSSFEPLKGSRRSGAHRRRPPRPRHRSRQLQQHQHQRQQRKQQQLVSVQQNLPSVHWFLLLVICSTVPPLHLPRHLPRRNQPRRINKCNNFRLKFAKFCFDHLLLSTTSSPVSSTDAGSFQARIQPRH